MGKEPKPPLLLTYIVAPTRPERFSSQLVSGLLVSACHHGRAPRGGGRRENAYMGAPHVVRSAFGLCSLPSGSFPSRFLAHFMNSDTSHGASSFQEKCWCRGS